MAKREYIQANKDWLEAKAKEEGGTQKGLRCALATTQFHTFAILCNP